MLKTELLDHFTSSGSEQAGNAIEQDGSDHIGFKNATFTWSKESNKGTSSSTLKRSFRLVIEGEIKFQRGAVNLVVGPTGSGKTSLLMALLGKSKLSPPCCICD